jgi:hypothetical protein
MTMSGEAAWAEGMMGANCLGSAEKMMAEASRRARKRGRAEADECLPE